MFLSLTRKGKKGLKKRIEKGMGFFLGVVFLSLVLLVFGLVIEVFLERFVGYVAGFLLSLFGYKITFLGGKPFEFLVSLGNLEAVIIISYLCTGWFEFSILSSAIIFSEARKTLKFLGIFCALVFVFFVNILRIFGMVVVILSTGNTQLIFLSHEVFFRLTIFLTLVMGFWLWLLFVKKTEKKNNRKGFKKQRNKFF